VEQFLGLGRLMYQTNQIFVVGVDSVGGFEEYKKRGVETTPL